MHVGKQKDSCSYYMEGMKLVAEEAEKDLGVWISSNMKKCSQQCMYAFNKASRVMGMIKRTIRFKEVKIMLSLYKTLRPHVEYCASAWSPYYKKDKEVLKRVQRRFTKMIVNMDGLSYKDRLQSLKLWSLEERRNRQDLIEVFKMSKGMTRIRLQ